VTAWRFELRGPPASFDQLGEERLIAEGVEPEPLVGRAQHVPQHLAGHARDRRVDLTRLAVKPQVQRQLPGSQPLLSSLHQRGQFQLVVRRLVLFVTVAAANSNNSSTGRGDQAVAPRRRVMRSLDPVADAQAKALASPTVVPVENLGGAGSPPPCARGPCLTFQSPGAPENQMTSQELTTKARADYVASSIEKKR
jgi:hypothetical protein